jgi:hypothetical protein
MHIHKQIVEGIIPYIIIVDDGLSEYIYKKGNGKRAFFRTRNSAEKRALWLSKEHPRWKITVKLSNGIPL